MSKRKITYIVILSLVVLGCAWAFISAGVITKNFKKEGIDQSVDLDKAIGFTEQLEREIEETKEQLRETNSEEKKAQQERKKVLDI